jgi:hypothetical protein
MNKEDLKNTNKDYNQAVLLLLQNSSQFKENFKQFAPNISSEIESASTNANCSCKHAIISFINERKDIFNEFLYNFLVLYDLLKTFKGYLDSLPIYKSLSGKIAKTKMSEWSEFSNNLIKDYAIFKSFSVVKDGDDLLVFFL